MSNATITILDNNSTTSEILAVHNAVFGITHDDRKYSQKRPDFHLANLKSCLKRDKIISYCVRNGWDIETVTLGQIATVHGEMKIAQRLAIVQSGCADHLAAARGVATLVSIWANETGIDWAGV